MSKPEQIEVVSIATTGLNPEGVKKVRRHKGVKEAHPSKQRSPISGKDRPILVVHVDVSRASLDEVISAIVNALTPYGADKELVTRRVRRHHKK